jgi:hypothetical protein
MNERIRELAVMANPSSKEIYEADNWQYNCAAWDSNNLKKFAELIVRECVRECKQEWYDTNNDPELNAETDTRMIGIKIGIKQGSLKCISRIKEHFGAEE